MPTQSSPQTFRARTINDGYSIIGTLLSQAPVRHLSVQTDSSCEPSTVDAPYVKSERSFLFAVAIRNESCCGQYSEKGQRNVLGSLVCIICTFMALAGNSKLAAHFGRNASHLHAFDHAKQLVCSEGYARALLTTPLKVKHHVRDAFCLQISDPCKRRASAESRMQDKVHVFLTNPSEWGLDF